MFAQTKLMRLLFFCCIIFSVVACSTKQSVDLIVHNGLVYTVDSSFDTAQAFAIKDGKIVAVGKNEDILNNYESKEMVDAGGKPVYPGFIDAHAHFIGYGQSLFTADLYGATS